MIDGTDRIMAARQQAMAQAACERAQGQLSGYFTEAPAIALRKWALDRAIAVLSLPTDAGAVVAEADKIVAWIEGAQS